MEVLEIMHCHCAFHLAPLPRSVPIGIDKDRFNVRSIAVEVCLDNLINLDYLSKAFMDELLVPSTNGWRYLGLSWRTPWAFLFTIFGRLMKE